MNNIREYLVREAARLTDAAGDRFHSKEQLIAAPASSPNIST